MNPNRALAAILDDHLGARFPARRDGSKFSKRAFGKANSALGFELFQYVGESQLKIGVLFGRADFCDGCSTVSDKKSLAFADCAQIASEAVLEFTAANPLHVATSFTLVATMGVARNQKVSFRLRPRKDKADPSLRSG